MSRTYLNKPPQTHQTPKTEKVLKAQTSAPNNLPQPSAVLPAVAQPNGLLTFTKITGTHPKRLTKIIGLNADGTLKKEAAAELVKGKAEKVVVRDLGALGKVLDSLKSEHAVSWGVMKEANVTLCTSSDENAKANGALPRTRENFAFQSGPGIMMLDHDGMPDGSLTMDEFYGRLIAAAPPLASASMLGRPSASSGCYHPNGVLLTPLTRHRLYISVLDASLIPSAGQALNDLLWATPGDGWIAIGNAGQALKRCLVDTMVWQPERLDFASPPILQDGVTRPLAANKFYGSPNVLFDLRVLINCVTAEIKAAADAARKAAIIATKQQRLDAANSWAANQAPMLSKKRGITVSKALDVLKRASLHWVLMGDFELTAEDGSTVAVAELLNNPVRYNGTRYADPLDPDHDLRVATVHFNAGTRPTLYSFRHGGMKFELRRQSARVEIGRGLIVDATDEVLRVLAERNELFNYGDKAIAFVANRKASVVDADWLLDHLGRVIDFYTVRVRQDKDGNQISRTEIPDDAPPKIVAPIMAKHDSRNFHRLEAVCTAPVLRLDGSVLDSPGYDAQTQLLYFPDPAQPKLRVPLQPTEFEALDALAEIWQPFRKFPIADPVSVGVLLSAVLTAALRPSLPTSPAFGFDAPSAGTGKTLLAKCVGAIGSGTEVSVTPPVRDEEEWRKRLFAILACGDTVLLLDNVREPLGNAAIDSFITSRNFKERQLGHSVIQELPNRSLFLITGNNLILTGDTHRRVLKVRLDAQSERPSTREFDFDPLKVCLEERQKLVVAALTIVRAHIAANRPKVGTGGVGSFPEWNELVRQPLCWLAQVAKASNRTDLPDFSDPALSITRSESENPETEKLSSLLNGWYRCFGDKKKTLAQAASGSKGTEGVGLDDAFQEIAATYGKVNMRTLGKWFDAHKEQRVDGLRLVRTGKAGGVVVWQVVATAERAAQFEAEEEEKLRQKEEEQRKEEKTRAAIARFKEKSKKSKKSGAINRHIQ